MVRSEWRGIWHSTALLTTTDNKPSKSLWLQGALSCSRYHHSLPERTVDPLLCVVTSLRKCQDGSACTHTLGSAFTSLGTAISTSAWHEKELVNICFSFLGISSSKKCLLEWWIKFPSQGWLVSDLYLKCFVSLWLFLLHNSEFSEKSTSVFFDCIFYIAACCRSWSCKKFSDDYNSLNNKSKHLLGRELNLGWFSSSMVD